MLQYIVAVAVAFPPAELAELDDSLAAITIRGNRLPDFMQVFLDVKASLKMQYEH